MLVKVTIVVKQSKHFGRQTLLLGNWESQQPESLPVQATQEEVNNSAHLMNYWFAQNCIETGWNITVDEPKI